MCSVDTKFCYLSSNSFQFFSEHRPRPPRLFFAISMCNRWSVRFYLQKSKGQPGKEFFEDCSFLSHDKMVLVFVPWKRSLKVGIALHLEWMSLHLKRKHSLSGQDRQSGKMAKPYVLPKCLTQLKRLVLLIKGFVTLEFLPRYSWCCCCCWRLKVTSQLSVCVD